MVTSKACRIVRLLVCGTALICGYFASANSASAASIRQIGTSELLNGSELILHGQVIDKWSEAGPVQGSIVTKVVLSVTDLIKGEAEEPTITLTFLGGTLGNLRQQIDGSNIPALGEEGVYFLEDPDRFLINPMFGWTQGHYIVDPASRRVRTFAGAAVFGIQAQDGPKQLDFAHGHAVGIVTRSTTKYSAPIDVDEFKRQLRSLMGGRQ